MLRLSGMGCKVGVGQSGFRVYSGLSAKVRPTGTNAHTHFKPKRSKWNVTKCFLEVAGPTIGGSTVHIMFPFTASFCKAASIAPCGPCQSSHSKKRGHRSARCTGKSLDRAEKHRSSGGRWNNLGTILPTPVWLDHSSCSNYLSDTITPSFQPGNLPGPHQLPPRWTSQETLHGIAQEDHIAAQCLDTHFLGVMYLLYQLIRTCRYTLNIYKLRFESEIIYKCRFDWETQI